MSKLATSPAARFGAAVELAIVILVAGGMLLATRRPDGTPYDNYALLADAFVHGRAWIDWPGNYIDAIAYHGQRYVIEAPFPALIVIPLLRIWGPTGVSQTMASVIAGTAAVALFWSIFRQIGLGRAQRLALCAFTFAGTDLWWCSKLGDVWFFSPVVAVACTALALAECFGKRRGWLVGIAAVCAFESRATLAPAFLLYPYLLAGGHPPDLIKKLRNYAIVLATGAAVYVGYNEIRWQTLTDIGYDLFCAQDDYCSQSPFGLKYLIYELYAFFVRAPDLALGPPSVAVFPYLRMSADGIALTFSSPALIAVFWAKRSREQIALWITAALVAVPAFIYYVDGFKQVGMRHALDFEPFLVVLMALAFRDNARRWFYFLILLSVIAGIWQVWYWDTFES